MTEPNRNFCYDVDGAVQGCFLQIQHRVDVHVVDSHSLYEQGNDPLGEKVDDKGRP